MTRALISIVLGALFGISAIAHPSSGIVVDKDGQVFFTDTGNGVWKIDKQGNLISLPSSRFHWLALDESGSFANSQKNFGEWFERVTPEGSKPSLIISSDFPLAISRDGVLYYADTRPRRPRIVRRTADGRETVVAEDDSFKGIGGIVVGPDGAVYITNEVRRNVNVVRKIARDGKISQVVSAETVASGADRAVSPPLEAESNYCRGLYVDSDGTVYVAHTGSRRVIKVTPKDEVTTVLRTESPWSPTGVAVFGGEVYVLEWKDPPAAQGEERRAWIPRVRKVGRDGKISTLATISRDATPSPSPTAAPESSNAHSSGNGIAIAVATLIAGLTIVGIKVRK